VSQKAANASPAMKSTGRPNSASTEKATTAKHASVTSCARRRPRQLSSVSASALAMAPRNSGITASGWPV
jgi:hypothetical protein